MNRYRHWSEDLNISRGLVAALAGTLLAIIALSCGGPGNKDMRHGVPLPGFNDEAPDEHAEQQTEQRAMAAATTQILPDLWNPPDLPLDHKFIAIGATGKQWVTGAHAIVVQTPSGNIDIWVDDGVVWINSYKMQGKASVGGPDNRVMFKFGSDPRP